MSSDRNPDEIAADARKFVESVDAITIEAVNTKPHTELLFYDLYKELYVIEDKQQHGQILLRHGPGDVAEIMDLFVQEYARRNGVGRELMEMAFNHCRKHEIRLLHLFCKVDNEHAVLFYMSCDMEIETCMPGFYADSDAYMFVKEIV